MSNKKSKISIILIANLMSFFITAGISFLLTPFLVKNLGEAMYGFYGIANIFVNLITVVAIALNSMMAKYITVELERKNITEAKKYFSSVFISNVILCIVLTPILISIIVFLDKIVSISPNYIMSVRILFSLVFLSMLINFISSVYGCATYAKNRMDLNAYVVIVRSIIKLMLYGFLFYFFKPSIIYIGIVVLLLEIYNIIVQYKICKRLLVDFNIKKKYMDFKLIIKTIKVGIWNSVNHLGDLLLSSSDLYMSNILLGEMASGNISIIKTLPTLISGIISSINSVFMPRIAITYAKNDNKLLIYEIQKAQEIMGFITTPIIVMLLIFNEYFYKLWVPSSNIKLLVSLSIIDLIRMLIIGVVWPIVNLNIVMDKIKKPAIFMVISGILNVISMILLIKEFEIGIYAIVLTTLVITILYYGLYIPFYASKISNISIMYFYKAIIKMIICTIILLIIFYPIHSLFMITNWFEFALYGGISGLISIIISAIVYKIVNIKSIIKKIRM